MTTHKPFRFGIVAGQARSGEEWIAKARRAEQLGFATFLIPDTLGGTLAPFPALAAAAAATKSIHVGPYVLANDFRNPVLVAREAATIDFLSGGRFELGLGAGRPGVEIDNRALGLSFDAGGVRVERLAEALGVIKALFSGQPAPSGGAHYPIDGAELFPKPVNPSGPPILIAGLGKRLLTLAAREANSVALAIGPAGTMGDFKEKVEWLREAAGERFEQLELNINLVAVGDQVPEWLRTRMGIDPVKLAEAGSPAVLRGTTDEMCEQLLQRREELGISYITLSDAFMDACGPVVERLAGQ